MNFATKAIWLGRFHVNEGKSQFFETEFPHFKNEKETLSIVKNYQST